MGGGHDKWDPEALGLSPASRLDIAFLWKSGKVGARGPFLVLFVCDLGKRHEQSSLLGLDSPFAKVSVNTSVASSAQHSSEVPAACRH